MITPSDVYSATIEVVFNSSSKHYTYNLYSTHHLGLGDVIHLTQSDSRLKIVNKYSKMWAYVRSDGTVSNSPNDCFLIKSIHVAKSNGKYIGTISLNKQENAIVSVKKPNEWFENLINIYKSVYIRYLK